VYQSFLNGVILTFRTEKSSDKKLKNGKKISSV